MVVNLKCLAGFNFTDLLARKHEQTMRALSPSILPIFTRAYIWFYTRDETLCNPGLWSPRVHGFCISFMVLHTERDFVMRLLSKPGNSGNSPK